MACLITCGAATRPTMHIRHITGIQVSVGVLISDLGMVGLGAMIHGSLGAGADGIIHIHGQAMVPVIGMDQATVRRMHGVRHHPELPVRIVLRMGHLEFTDLRRL